MKIALFKSTLAGAIVPWDESFTNTSGAYVRTTEWVDVDFPALPDVDTANAIAAAKANRLSALYAEIAALKGE